MILDQAIRTRRSIRRYTNQAVSAETITMLITAATDAPSAHNRQPWRFAPVMNTSTKVHLAEQMGARLRADLERDNVPEEIIIKDTTRSYSRITGAPALIVIALSMVEMDTYPDPVRAGYEYHLAAQSTAMAVQNLLLTAHACGLGACWMCAPLFVPDLVRAVLDLPDDWQPQALITLGYPREQKISTRAPVESRILWR